MDRSPSCCYSSKVRTRAAELLGISRRAIYNKLKTQHSLSPPIVH
ncbi:MAG: helix-turn-helix domain-containing protein [bacterium]